MSALCHQIQITTSTVTYTSTLASSSSSTYFKSFDQLSISSSTLRLSRSASINLQRFGILLRSSETKSQFSRLWTIGSLGQGEGGREILFGSDEGESQVNESQTKSNSDHHRSFVLGVEERIGDVVDENSRYDLTKEAEEEEKEGTTASCGGDLDRDRKVEVLVAAAATVVLGVGNRVLYKLALVPLRHYPFFLAQIATFGYVLVYFSILYFRYHAGVVTNEMLSLPKVPFLLVGFLEALAAASGMAAVAVLSGESIPILSQTFLIWQLLLSALFLGRRYRINQIFGCFLVAIGVIITVASGSGAGLSLKGAGIFWTLLMITSFFLQAADTVLKETIFLNAAQKLKGGSVDLFVVNSYGSAFQALFICLLLPFLSKLWGIPFSQLPGYLKDGAACFLNIGTLSKGCEGAPLLPLLFVIVNMAYNISLLHLLKISSAVVSCLASTFSVPLSVFAFTLPLPYIGEASSLPGGFVMGTGVLIVGLLFYCWKPSVRPSTFTNSSLINRKTN